MTTLQKTSRASFVRQRRSSRTRKASTPPASKPSGSAPRVRQTTQTARRSYNPSTMVVTGKSRLPAATSTRRTARAQAGQGYDISFSLGHTAVHAPTLTLPRLGSRWISGVLTLLFVFILYSLWTASAFAVKGAVLRGNQRLSDSDVNAMLAVINKPVFSILPSQVEASLLSAFPDLSAVKVSVGLPDRLTVSVTERTPLLAWVQGDNVKWIDASGIAFPPRGDVQGLVQVSATGDPTSAVKDATGTTLSQQFLDPAMVQALLIMAPQVPSGMTMTYDAQFGMGWQDPRGWSVYFGQNTDNISTKLMVYQAIVDSLTRQGIQPTLISVENLNAPFYK